MKGFSILRVQLINSDNQVVEFQDSPADMILTYSAGIKPRLIREDLENEYYLEGFTLTPKIKKVPKHE